MVGVAENHNPLSRALVVDLFCGLGGWAGGFLSEGYDVIGFDIERWPYPGQLVLQDVLTLHGSRFKDATIIVASPPCQAYSYMAMPWARGKKLAAWYREDPERVKELNALFDACFRIQREASEAAGHKIPMIVENVRGAQKWVGRARWHYGSYYLWGDVPALMPIPFKARKHGSDFSKRPISHWRDKGSLDYIKQHGSGREWFAGEGKISRTTSSKSSARKQASAMIAKIPFGLASYIARTFRP